MEGVVAASGGVGTIETAKAAANQSEPLITAEVVANGSETRLFQALPGYIGCEGAIQPPHTPAYTNGDWNRARVEEGDNYPLNADAEKGNEVAIAAGRRWAATQETLRLAAIGNQNQDDDQDLQQVFDEMKSLPVIGLAIPRACSQLLLDHPIKTIGDETVQN